MESPSNEATIRSPASPHVAGDIYTAGEVDLDCDTVTMIDGDPILTTNRAFRRLATYSRLTYSTQGASVKCQLTNLHATYQTERFLVNDHFRGCEWRVGARSHYWSDSVLLT